MENNSRGVRKGTWTKEEDKLLKICIEKHGEGKWHQVPLRAGLNRCRKSCRLRWLNYLRSNIKKGRFSKDEVDLVLRLHALLGNRWSLIAGRLPGRTANDVKNFWNTHVDKKLAFGQGRIPNNNNNNNVNVQKTKTSTESNIVRPRPRTFTTLLHVNQPTEVVSNNGEKSSDGNNQKQCSDVSFSSLEKVDDHVQWWSKLLELSENRESEMVMAEETNQIGEASSSGLDDGSSIFSLEEFDFWELLNLDDDR